MKLGKTRMKRILSEETGIPVRDIRIHGKYEYHGNKEQITIGSHEITAINGRVWICEPVIREDTEDITYRSREIKIEHPHEPASSGARKNNQLHNNR